MLKLIVQTPPFAKLQPVIVNKTVLTDEAGLPKLVSPKNSRTNAVQHDIEYTVSLSSWPCPSKLELMPCKSHLIRPVQEKFPHIEGRQGLLLQNEGKMGYRH